MREEKVSDLARNDRELAEIAEHEAGTGSTDAAYHAAMWRADWEREREMVMRVRRSTEQEFFDVFSDWPAADQEVALRIMSEIHRQAVRQAKKKTPAPTAPAESELPTGEVHL